MLSYLKSIIESWNSRGLNIPVVRDPITQRGSITASLVAISSLCVIISLFYEKMSASAALDFYLASLGAYLGRKLMSKDNVVVESSDNKTT